MAGIKVSAHPLVLAVAMGLLGPGAVLDERHGTVPAVQPLGPHDLDEPEAPSADEYARVEHLWHEVRTDIG